MSKQLTCRQEGAFSVEFALVGLAFFAFVFAILELARALYMLNILQEVTRRAGNSAAVADFSNSATMDQVRKDAVLDGSSGRLVLGDPITSDHVRIDYLSIARDASGAMSLDTIPTGSLPASPARNRINCLDNVYGDHCIRLVRVRICDPDNTGDCDPVQYQPVFPLVSLPFGLPKATTVIPAETLGFVPGDTP